MLRSLSDHRREARLWFYGIAASAVLGTVILALASERLELRLIGVTVLVTALLVGIFEGLVAAGRQSTSAVVFAETQEALNIELGGLPRFIRDAREVDILAGTGRMFCVSDNLRALFKAHHDGARVRILIMHHVRGATDAERESRNARGVATTDEKYATEIQESVTKIAETFGPLNTNQILRLYFGTRKVSVYRFDEHFFVTLNVAGRGSSAPAFYFRKAAPSAAFSRRLIEIFDELCSARLSEAVTDDLLLELRASAAGTPKRLHPQEPQGGSDGVRAG